MENPNGADGADAGIGFDPGDNRTPHTLSGSFWVQISIEVEFG